MSKTTKLVLFLVLSLFAYAFAEESLTITTYYPSPYGSYNELSTNKLALGGEGSATSPMNKGSIRFNEILTGNPTGSAGELAYFGSSVGFKYHGGGSTGWKSFGSAPSCVVRSASCEWNTCDYWTIANGGDSSSDDNLKRYKQVSCDTGETMMSGGCKFGDHDGNAIGSWPVDSNTWGCASGGISYGLITAYAICCTF
jgi:hypothetical protein